MVASWAARQKILLLLLSGLSLGLTRSPKQHFRILRAVPKAWRDIERRALYRALREFKERRLVDLTEKADGSVEVILTENGKKKALAYKIDEMKITEPARWDKKWRLVIFDIPEKKKRAREALREKLKELGFKELQKSVFVHPFESKDEVDFIVEFFAIRPYVRFLRSDFITNEADLKLRFKLS